MNPVNSCRTCLIHIEQDPIKITTVIFEFMENVLQLNEIPREHDTVMLPQCLCFNCFQQLLQLKRFYTQCKDAEEYLKTRLQNTLRQESLSPAIDNIETSTTTPTHSKNEDQYDESTKSDFVIDNEYYENNYTESIIEYEMEEMVSIEQVEEQFEIQSEILDEEESLYLEYENNNLCVDDADPNDCDDIDNSLESLVKLENEDEFVEEVEDAIEVIYSDIESEQTKVPAKVVDVKTPGVHTNTNSNEKIRKKYNCHNCDKSFNSKSSLRSHEYIHSDARPYICEICGKAFRQSNILVTHMALHTGKKIECELCGKKFARKSQMILHDRMHKNEKPFVCDYPNCNAAFRQNQYLIAHKETHTGVRRYQCAICARTFFNRPSLLGHMHRVHGSLFYQCDMCERSFKKPQQVRNHMKSEHQIELNDVSHLKQRKANNYDNNENSTEL